LYVYVPICVAATCFLVDRVARLLSLAGMQAIAPRDRKGDHTRQHAESAGLAGTAATAGAQGLASTAATAVVARLADERIAFWLGVAIPIAALYPGAWALALLNAGTHPLVPGP